MTSALVRVNPLIWTPIGDSITHGVIGGPAPGVTDHGGYRGVVQDSMPGAGISYICSGRLTDPPRYGGHEGWDGFRTTDVLNDLDNLLAFTPSPAVATILLGTNDISQTATDAYKQQIPDRIGLIARRILLASPECWVLILPVTPCAPVQAWVDATNTRLPSIVAQAAQASGSGRVRLLPYPRTVTLSDGVHPDLAGYNTMAEAVYWPIVNIWRGDWSGGAATFPAPPPLPASIEVSVSASIDGVPYTASGVQLQRTP